MLLFPEAALAWDISGAVSALSNKLTSAALDLLAFLVLWIAKAIMYSALIVILIYIFAGWIKALLGAAFAPISLVMLPIDNGRMLSGVVGFILGSIGTYAFSLAVGMLMLNMFNKGAESMVNAISQRTDVTLTESSTFALGFALLGVLLSVMMFLVVTNAKNWGSEFFGSASFDMSSRTLNQALGKATASIAKSAGKGTLNAGYAAGSAASGAAAGAIRGAGGGWRGAAAASNVAGAPASRGAQIAGAVRGAGAGAATGVKMSTAGRMAAQQFKQASGTARALRREFQTRKVVQGASGLTSSWRASANRMKK